MESEATIPAIYAFWNKAMLCFLVQQAGGEVRVPADVIGDVMLAYELRMDIDEETDVVRMCARRKPFAIRPQGQGGFPAGTTYCLAELAAEACWTGKGFVPIEDYFDQRDDIPHYATLEEADAEVARRRTRRGDGLRVMVVEPGGTPMLLLNDGPPPGRVRGRPAGGKKKAK